MFRKSRLVTRQASGSPAQDIHNSSEIQQNTEFKFLNYDFVIKIQQKILGP